MIDVAAADNYSTIAEYNAFPHWARCCTSLILPHECAASLVLPRLIPD